MELLLSIARGIGTCAGLLGLLTLFVGAVAVASTDAETADGDPDRDLAAGCGRRAGLRVPFAGVEATSDLVGTSGR